MEVAHAAFRWPISGSAVVTVVQASKPCPGANATVRQRRTPASGRVFGQSEMGSIIVVVGDVLGEEPPQVTLVQCDHLAEQIAAAALHPALGHAILPGTSN